MRVTRRTFRTAVVVAGASAVLALPVGAAFADSDGPAGQLPGTGVEQPAHHEAGSQDQDKSQDRQDRQDKAQREGDRTSERVRTFVTTVTLADGSLARVYRFGDGNVEARISAGGVHLDTLVSTDGRPAYGQHNGLHVVLQPNGTVTSWVEGGAKKDEKRKDRDEKRKDERREDRQQHRHHKKDDRRSAPARVALPDGRIAKLFTGGAGGPRVEISMPNGSFLGAVDLKNPSTVDDGWTYKLVRDGKRTKFVVIDGKRGGDSWVYDFRGRLIEKYTVEKSTGDRATGKATTAEKHGKAGTAGEAGMARKDGKAAVADHVLPKGGVEAGAGGVEDGGGSEGPVLLAAGGGLAAAGAAGLGFALLRRRPGRDS
ncbi:hypothetical protein [Streptomyces sp. NPDC097619]|uniref:hypothetical protein n=1 Tax=Streptomyces sp. NPDC097619 TaxID=3157228 RepID=UPI003321E474